MRNLSQTAFEKTFRRDRIIFVSLLIAVVANIILWVLVAGKFGYSHERVPLHFNIAYGIDYVGGAKNAFEIPGVGLVVLLTNIFLARLIYGAEKIYSYFLVIAAAVVQIILLLSLVALVILNA